jgi:hypothetical protein
LLNNYLADTSKAWLFGGVAGAGEANWNSLAGGNQSYAARIAAFDPATGWIKLVSSGKGPGGSESRIYGTFRLQGLKPSAAVSPRFAWYVAGEARNVDEAVDVDGDVYFGGDVHFNGGASGSVFRGAFKVAKGSGNASSFDGSVAFDGDAYFQTPVKTNGMGLVFNRSAGFEADISADGPLRMGASGRTVYFNSDISGGNSFLDMAGKSLVDDGKLNLARVKNPGPIAHQAGPLAIAARLGMRGGAEQEVSVDISAIPPSKRISLPSLGYARWGATNGPELTRAYDFAKAAGLLYKGFLCINAGAGMNFVPVPDNILRGRFLFEVAGAMNVNGNFPVCEPASVCLVHVVNGGTVQGFGGPGLFRGYVNVSGTGSVIYQWGAGAEFRGAIHHVSTAAGFQLNASANPLKLVFDPGVFDDLAGLNVLTAPGSAKPPAAPIKVRLADTRIRPQFISRYF